MKSLKSHPAFQYNYKKVRPNTNKKSNRKRSYSE